MPGHLVFTNVFYVSAGQVAQVLLVFQPTPHRSLMVLTEGAFEKPHRMPPMEQFVGEHARKGPISSCANLESHSNGPRCLVPEACFCNVPVGNVLGAIHSHWEYLPWKNFYVPTRAKGDVEGKNTCIMHPVLVEPSEVFTNPPKYASWRMQQAKRGVVTEGYQDQDLDWHRCTFSLHPAQKFCYSMRTRFLQEERVEF